MPHYLFVFATVMQRGHHRSFSLLLTCDKQRFIYLRFLIGTAQLRYGPFKTWFKTDQDNTKSWNVLNLQICLESAIKVYQCVSSLFQNFGSMPLFSTAGWFRISWMRLTSVALLSIVVCSIGKGSRRQGIKLSFSRRLARSHLSVFCMCTGE